VQYQIEYGESRGVPWGVSESGYNRTDVHLNYQYRAFGVPGLGLKRGLAEDLVIAPYATLLSLMVVPRKACENLQRLAAKGEPGAYGFYEAVGLYSLAAAHPGKPARLSARSWAIIKAWGLLALGLPACWTGDAKAIPFLPRSSSMRICCCRSACRKLPPKSFRRISSWANHASWQPRAKASCEFSPIRICRRRKFTSCPMAVIHVVVSNAGGGYSRLAGPCGQPLARGCTRDCWGTFIYLRDTATGEFWSTAYQPTLRNTKRYEAIFTQGRAEFRHQNAGMEVHTEISVSPEDDIELRRLTLTNHSNSRRIIEVTSYAEVVLAQPAADARPSRL